MPPDSPPPDDTSATKPCFEIGLVMAGAVSAGAYTAGVLDFLFEALHNWYDRRNAPTGCRGDWPPHDVKIRVMAGASAGGIVAALATRMIDDFGRRDPDGPVIPGEYESPLYKAWVRDIDLVHLVGERDLAASDGVVSLLDTTILSDIASRAIPGDTGGFECKTPPYVSEPLDVVMTVTNLRGVPYDLRIDPGSGHREIRFMHGDHLNFVRANRKTSCEPGSYLVAPGEHGTPNWLRLRDAALATSAFPFVFKPIGIRRAAKDYDNRVYQDYYPYEYMESENAKAKRRVSREHATLPENKSDAEAAAKWFEDFENRCKGTRPAWPMGLRDDAEYLYLGVDGGATDNNPLELARRILAGGPGRHNPRIGKDATRAIVMIDPFPDADESNDREGGPSLWELPFTFLYSLINQCRFRPNDILLALDEQVYSRFLIAPSRRTLDQAPSGPGLACGALSGFGGFLSREFRDYDYRLGRRNCQQFLRAHFTLPEEADLFVKTTRDLGSLRTTVQDRREGHFPIIPLLGRIDEEIKLGVWPTLGESRVEAFVLGEKRTSGQASIPARRGIIDRVDSIVGRLTSASFIPDRFKRWFLEFGYRPRVMGGIRSSIVSGLRRRIREGLAKHQQLAGK